MITYLIQQIRRSLLRSVLFCVLLALAGTLLTLGIGLLMSAQSSLRDIDEQFTTVALPDRSAIRIYAMHRIESENISEYEGPRGLITTGDPRYSRDFTQIVAEYMTDDILNEIDEKVYLSGAVTMDPRRFFGAYSPYIIPVYDSDMTLTPGAPIKSVVFIVKVTDVIDNSSLGYVEDLDTGELRIRLRADTDVHFDVESVISFLSDQDLPETLDAHMVVFDSDGQSFFQAGERYLIQGIFRLRYFSHPHHFIVLPHERLIHDADVKTVGIIESLDEIRPGIRSSFQRAFRTQLTDDSLPIDITAHVSVNIEEYLFRLGDMSLEEALASGFGEAIESVISGADKNLSRVNIITTGNLNSLFQFHQHRASIVDGRSFTGEEYETGARVTVIDRRLAERNGLVTGDTVSITLFEGQHVNYTATEPNSDRVFSIWEPGGYAAGVPETEPMEFEIVGIYTAPYPRWLDPNALDRHSIPINTLFIPDNSIDRLIGPSGDHRNQASVHVPGGVPHREDRQVVPLLNVIVVQNGRNEEFRQSIDALIPGYGSFFRIFDQGYSIVRAAFDNLIRGGTLVLVLCLAGWLVSAIVFCLFFVTRKKGDAGLLYAMGFSRKSRFRWVFLQCLIIIIVAQATAFAASLVLQEQILVLAFGIAVEDSMAMEVTEFTDAVIAEEGSSLDFKLRQNLWGVLLGIGGTTITLLLMTYSISAAIAKKGILTLRALRD